MPRPQDFVEARLYDSEEDVFRRPCAIYYAHVLSRAFSWLYIAIELKEFACRKPPAWPALAGLR